MRTADRLRHLLLLAAGASLLLPVTVAAAQTDPDHPYHRDPTPAVLPLQVDEREHVRVWHDDRSPAAQGDAVVALTFDDGPHPVHTPPILDLLDDHGVPATFFVTGAAVEAHPDLAATVHARGHGVASHTVTHPELTELSDAEVREEVRRTDELIAEVTGRHPDCLRPPFGDRDDRVLDLLDEEGHASALWSNDPRDWERPGSGAIVERVLRDLSPGDVIILHDGPSGSDRSQTVDALPGILEGIEERGFAVVPFCHPPLATDRLGGPTRIDTAVEVAQRSHPDGAEIAYLAVADAFPDALAGAPAAAGDDAPILLTAGEALPAATRTELERLDPSELVVLGGRGAISEPVAAAAGAAAGAEVIRLAGAERAATAAEIAARSHPDGAEVVYLARADDFPDALAGGAAAAAEDAPILLAEPTALPAPTTAALAALDPDVVVVLGGTAAIDEATAQQAGALAGAQVDRVAGPERTATAAQVAARSHPDGADLVVVATGRAFPDALTGSAYAGAAGAPVLLVTAEQVAGPTAAALGRLRADRAVVVGGSGAVPEAVRRALARF